MLFSDTDGRAWTIGNVLFFVGMAVIGAVLMYLLYLSGPDVQLGDPLRSRSTLTPVLTRGVP